MKCSVAVFQAEYEEARKELQIEVAEGVSIDKIRARLQGGQVEEKKSESSGNGKAKSNNGGTQSRLRRMPSMPRISRKKWSTDDRSLTKN